MLLSLPSPENCSIICCNKSEVNPILNNDEPEFYWFCMKANSQTFYFLGSSVTFGSATDGVSFVEEIARATGATCVKNAVSGTTLAQTADGTQSYVERLADFDTKAKVNTLVVQLSTNDAVQNLPLGNMATSDTFDTHTVIGAIEYIIGYAKKIWQCDVLFYTNPCFNNAQYEKMIAALYCVQKKYNVDIIDFYYYRNMQRLSSDILATYMANEIHPNALGYKWMSEVFLHRLTTKT